ncbi:hypothetical protein BC828DRAFT_381808 [Blastocladiella britannica]|nr:hypothetical protein BC828DRAFT_381808 [Blastocladiella britannica]
MGFFDFGRKKKDRIVVGGPPVAPTGVTDQTVVGRLTLTQQQQQQQQHQQQQYHQQQYAAPPSTSGPSTPTSPHTSAADMYAASSQYAQSHNPAVYSPLGQPMGQPASPLQPPLAGGAYVGGPAGGAAPNSGFPYAMAPDSRAPSMHGSTGSTDWQHELYQALPAMPMMQPALASRVTGAPGYPSAPQPTVLTHSTGDSGRTAFQGPSGGSMSAVNPVVTNSDSDVPKCKYLVGIDFGTTQTGFGFIRTTNKANPNPEIISNEIWDMQPQGIFSAKTPTVLAYNIHDRNLKAFSWAARAQGADMQYERIERIKLALEESIPINERPTLPADLDPVRIIADFLYWIHENMMSKIKQRYPMDKDLTHKDFLYCFTVPVGWSQTAHQSIRRAAAIAGLLADENSTHLIFVYEPEAAALSCVHESDIDIEANSKLLVVDCGGGTVDWFLAQLDENRDLEELTMSDGKFLGASRVDTLFWNLLREKIGLIAFEKFKTQGEFRHYFNEMEWKWEFFKRQFNGRMTNAFLIQVPQPLLAIMQESKLAKLDNGDIRLTENEVRALFDPVIDEIIIGTRNQLRQALSQGVLKVNYLYVVGGFGCNPYVRARVTEDPEVKAMIDYPMLPRRPEAAVLRGAVWCALNHQNIKSRKARRTVGIGLLRRYDPARDDVSEITTTDPDNPSDLSKAYVPKSVYVFVSKGQTISFNGVHRRSGFRCKTTDQSQVDVCIWGSDKVARAGGRLDSSECEPLGNMQVVAQPSNTGLPRSFTIQIAYGRVEISVRVIDEATGESWCRFLNHGHFKYVLSLFLFLWCCH